MADNFDQRVGDAAEQVVAAHNAWRDAMAPYFGSSGAGDRTRKSVSPDALSQLDELYREYLAARTALTELAELPAH